VRHAIACLLPRDHAKLRVRSDRGLPGSEAIVAGNDFTIVGIARKRNGTLVLAANCDLSIISVKAVLGAAVGTNHHNRGSDAQIKAVVVSIAKGATANANLFGCIFYTASKSGNGMPRQKAKLPATGARSIF
jgi:hypothetical protein